MQQNMKYELYKQMIEKLEKYNPQNWIDIDAILMLIRKPPESHQVSVANSFPKEIKNGIAFLTYDYGIDGVSIEMSKYAMSLQNIVFKNNKPQIHFIGGNFYPHADTVIKPEWKRFKLSGSNGWGKWENAFWYDQLFNEKMPQDSQQSDNLAEEIWKQAVLLSKRLGKYLAENNIHLLIPVNVCSNPGNLALGLCIPLVTELMDLYVLNLNHDYYWEGGKPASEKKLGDMPGPRDHFFKNYENRKYFDFFVKLYPWNGTKWIQTNINKLQSDKLIEKYNFASRKVFELATSISNDFFTNYTEEDIKSVRLRMAHVLSDGSPQIVPQPVKKYLEKLEHWMSNQKPLVCAFSENLVLDITTKDTIYLLQPTRVIGRKRIKKDIELIDALLHYQDFRNEFNNNKKKQIILHITGPVPIEHQHDLEVILNTFIEVCKKLPKSVSNRLFLAFSVGTEEHSIFPEKGLKRLYIHDIYQLATAIVFPSETEGRGLPIVESSAGGVPIICSRYFPVEVFDEVVGKTLDEKEQIKYTLFPENGFPQGFLNSVTDLLLYPEKNKIINKQNRKAVQKRYSEAAMEANLQDLLIKFV
jgi:glycosyltransferase involved in cell wall biosynthesis